MVDLSHDGDQWIDELNLARSPSAMMINDPYQSEPPYLLQDDDQQFDCPGEDQQFDLAHVKIMDLIYPMVKINCLI